MRRFCLTELTAIAFAWLAAVTCLAGTAADPSQARGHARTRRQLAASSSANLAPDGKSLKDAYLAALEVSEVVGEQREMWVQMMELERQAKAAMLPQITGAVNLTRQATPTNTNAFQNSATTSTGRISLDQPLFRGLRDFAALNQRKELTGAQASAAANAARQLFYDTATAYYNVLAYASDVANYTKEIELDNKRLGDLEAFYKIGRSQLTDVLTQKSALATLQVSLAASRMQLETARDVLAFECGWPKDTPLRDTETGDKDGDLKAYLAKIEERADVRLAAENVKAYEEGIPIARGQYYPSLDLLGDYYFEQAGIPNASNWDVQLALTVPIFTGGTIQSQVRQAESVSRQYNLALSQARRTAEEEIRTYFDDMIWDQKQLDALVSAVDLARQTYETEIRYYRNGLVTNLDVLTAITTYQDDQRLLDHQRMAVQSDMTHLQAATGQRPEIAVKLAESSRSNTDQSQRAESSQPK